MLLSTGEFTFMNITLKYTFMLFRGIHMTQGIKEAAIIWGEKLSHIVRVL